MPAVASPAVLPPAALPQAVAPVRQPLTPELVALSQKVRYALWMYQHQRLLNTGTNASWEVMHRIVAFGAATEVLRDGPRGEPVNAIGWLLWGGRCNSQQLLVLNGGRPYGQVGPGVQGHNGQFLGMLAQSKVRPESPFELQGQHFTVRDLIEQEKLSCEPNTELTFELIALSYYLKSDEVWTARSGEQWSISRLVQEEIKQPIQGAACGGSHRLFGLSSAYKMRIAEGKPVDGEFLRAQKYIHAYQSYALGTIRNRDGSFSTDWFRGPADNGDLDRKIQTTGHILEWLVFSLDDNQLRDPRVVQSVDFLATQIAKYPNRAWSVGPLGHALHAMAIYQSRVLVESQLTVQQQTASARASDLQPLPTAARGGERANLSRQQVVRRHSRRRTRRDRSPGSSHDDASDDRHPQRRRRHGGAPRPRPRRDALTTRVALATKAPSPGMAAKALRNRVDRRQPSLGSSSCCRAVVLALLLRTALPFGRISRGSDSLNPRDH